MALSEYQQQPNLVLWSERMTGARLMLQAIMEATAEKGCQFKLDVGERVYHDAIIKLITSNRENLERFIAGEWKYIAYRNHVRNNKGKLISVEAYF